MNTNDFTPYEYKGDESFHLIFEKHRELFMKYMENEPYTWTQETFDINVAEDQFMLKDFLQIRFTEELNEATLDMKHIDHFEEEMVDAFNFLLAAYFIYGYTYEDLGTWKDIFNTDNIVKRGDRDIINSEFYKVIEKVGRTCNYLKNSRCWKNTQYLVDLMRFEEDFKEIWKMFNMLCIYCGLSKQRIFEIWSCKYQVNSFRLETKY